MVGKTFCAKHGQIMKIISGSRHRRVTYFFLQDIFYRTGKEPHRAFTKNPWPGDSISSAKTSCLIWKMMMTVTVMPFAEPWEGQADCTVGAHNKHSGSIAMLAPKSSVKEQRERDPLNSKGCHGLNDKMPSICKTEHCMLSPHSRNNATTSTGRAILQDNMISG